MLPITLLKAKKISSKRLSLVNVQYVSQDGVEENGGDHENRCHQHPNVLGVAVANPPAELRISNRGHAGTEEDRIKQIHIGYCSLER